MPEIYVHVNLSRNVGREAGAVLDDIGGHRLVPSRQHPETGPKFVCHYSLDKVWIFAADKHLDKRWRKVAGAQGSQQLALVPAMQAKSGAALRSGEGTRIFDDHERRFHSSQDEVRRFESSTLDDVTATRSGESLPVGAELNEAFLLLGHSRHHQACILRAIGRDRRAGQLSRSSDCWPTGKITRYAEMPTINRVYSDVERYINWFLSITMIFTSPRQRTVSCSL
ncbi:hypothetical protein BV22DRAFT_34019 [Leucogyrophana mollusca]|uniref:Uncharacterized protein n=1 Tax=Leucogyrophana mollusca TaxID=85980 RepID=A0ACB8BZP4_9AGAM|nr:hypothetical protein BV22DRAFT_34019 [Leucogyrophana mollusca]